MSGGTELQPSRYPEGRFAMTTQIPYDPVPAQPMPAYPTSPPWAPPPPPVEAEPGPPWAGTPYTKHGQLMVPYPELMNAAGRPAPPSWAPVVVVSVLLSVLGTVAATALGTMLLGTVDGAVLGVAGGSLGLLGAITAARRAGQAKRGGNVRYPYWLAFGLALVAAGAPGLAALDLTERLVQAEVIEPAVIHAVQSDMLRGREITMPAGVTVRSAACTPVGDRGSDGLRQYRCMITLSSGQTGTLRVVADRKGTWTTAKNK